MPEEKAPEQKTPAQKETRYFYPLPNRNYGLYKVTFDDDSDSIYNWLLTRGEAIHLRSFFPDRMPTLELLLTMSEMPEIAADAPINEGIAEFVETAKDYDFEISTETPQNSAKPAV